MTFTESSTVETLVRDLLCGGITHHTAVGPGFARRHGKLSGLGWHYLSSANIPRQPHEVFVEDWVREALMRLTAASDPSAATQAPTLREAWAAWEESGRTFWPQMDAVVDLLDSLVAEEEQAHG